MDQIRGDGRARRQPMVEAARGVHVAPLRLRASRNHQEMYNLS
jgi:hypothetical protein